MQGREYEVTGECGFDGDLRRFKVANLTDQNDVGILAQEGAKSGGEVQPDLFFHLHLVDARQIELDRVFRRHDIGVDCIQ